MKKQESDEPNGTPPPDPGQNVLVQRFNRTGLRTRPTLAVEPEPALAIEQQLVVHVRQQELHTPALHPQLVLHHHDGAAVVTGLRARDQADLISGGQNQRAELATFLEVLNI